MLGLMRIVFGVGALVFGILGIRMVFNSYGRVANKGNSFLIITIILLILFFNARSLELYLFY